MMPVYCLHIHEKVGPMRSQWWVVADATTTLAGKITETRATVLKRWTEKYGKPDRVIVYKGFHTRPEAAASLADIQINS